MSPAESPLSSPAHPGTRQLLRPRHVHFYRLSDDFSGLLICALCLFSPWAFGTTQNWSTWVMNIGGYILGLLWLAKLYLRHFKGYPASRHDGALAQARVQPSDCPTVVPCEGRIVPTSHFPTGVLFVLTIAILVLTLISALNARATYDPGSFSFIYHEAITWLPSSLDRPSTWFAFWQYLGLAACFWALRDWLLSKSDREHRAAGSDHRIVGPWDHPTMGPSDHEPVAPSHRRTLSPSLLPARLRMLLWILCVNGALLGIEGILQRLEGSGRLLFLIKPTVNPGADTQFGPWAYRANAAAYFNLLWPVCLGFWWTLHRSSRSWRSRHHLLLLCVAVMAACPIISTSRGGAVISIALALGVALFLGSAHVLLDVPRDWTIGRWATTLFLILVFLAGGLYLGYRLGWASLAPRMEEFEVGLEQREQLFEVARPIARDYPWFGTGPGTFGWVFQLYRGATNAYWPAQLHNDWLETRITFGWVGTALIGAALVLVLARWFRPGGIHGGRRLIALIWLAMAGVLVHARWDFPFQIHSIVFLFLLLSSLLSCLSRRAKTLRNC